VSTNIANFGPGTFQGTVCAAIFDASQTFMDFVDTIPNVTFDSGYSYSATFNYPGSVALLPGTYSIATYYKAPGGNWMLVGNYQTFTNFLPMQIVYSNTIEMNASMNVSPGTTLTAGQQVSVHLDVVNNGSTAFNGTFDVSLYDLDGYAVATIQQLTGMTLPAGEHYTNGLTFTTTNLDALPGTYLMAVQYLADGGYSWNLVGSTHYSNPIYVRVEQANLIGDPYEPNGNASQAYNLAVNFSGNTATVNTPGANCNTGNDYDFYKITLSQGYSYVITARVDDASHNADLGNYTLYAIWIDSIAGGQRSPVYTGAAPNDIVLTNGGTVFFEVGPEFTGFTGTYNLVLIIKKNPMGIAENGLNSIKVYPNPANDYITIESPNLQQYPTQVKITTVDGRVVMNVEPGQNQDKIRIPVGNLPDGVYFLQAVTPDGVISKQVVVSK